MAKAKSNKYVQIVMKPKTHRELKILAAQIEKTMGEAIEYLIKKNKEGNMK